ncbi:hypothetical protein LRS06_20700 [Hymenobacter sp. J193]|uniref:hypothetical protein n=1 Tax=Hymenobacter sp. J193 TaxID=2898429 RepID=UPI0021515EDF|nr:hypothetical protein [Hymenobacter sp. J193]MCR5890150.1 hypothetical protein [Hymenobacter sp. J193]
MKRLVTTLLVGAALWVGSVPASGQTTARKRLVYFKDKTESPFRLDQPGAFLSPRAQERRQRQNIPLTVQDLPVNPGYVAQVKAVAGVSYWYPSRWFNAVMISCDDATLAKVQALPFVRQASTLNRPAATTPQPTTYAPRLPTQLLLRPGSAPPMARPTPRPCRSGPWPCTMLVSGVRECRLPYSTRDSRA